MKKIIMSLVLMAGFVTAWAQPIFTIGDASVNNGDQVCLPVTVDHFTDLMSMDLVFEWDPNELMIETPAAQNFTGLLPGLGLANFNVTSDSTLHLMWQVANCEDDPDFPGITFADGTVVFEICFTALGGYGESTDVCIANDPAPVIFRTNSNCLNIGLINECGSVYTGVSPVVITASDETGNTGDLICVDFTVDGFVDLQSTQFEIVWDPAVLSCVNQIPGDIPNLSNSNFNCLPPNKLRVSWASLPDQGVTVDDGTLFFTACFEVLAPCESFTSLDLNLDELIEITNTTSPEDGFQIPYEYHAGTVITGDCDPIGLQLFADCGDPVNINDQVCVEVTVGDNFFAITDMNFFMEWNEQILTYTGVQNVNNSVVNLNGAITPNPDLGIIEVDWTGPPPASIPNGDVLFEVCYTVTGLGGDSPFTFVQSPANVQSMDGPNIGVNPSNCTVVVNQPEGVGMTLGSGSAAVGEEFCVNIDVTNFDQISSYQFSLNWNPALFQYTNSSIINFPGANNSNITVAAEAGLMFFDFDGIDPITLADGTTIIEMCFIPLGTPGTCDPLSMITLPIAPEAISEASNGENIGIIDTPGELCTLFPEGFGIYIDSVTGPWLETICVPISVASFDNITDAELTIVWDPTVLGSATINNLGTWPGLSEGDGTLSLSDGILTIDWSMPGGTAIPDDTDVLELCFELIGDAPTCTPISVSQTIEPVISTTNGQGSLTYEDGEVCIEDRYIITDLIITPTSCEDVCDGTITFSVIGGTEPLGTTWVQNGQQQFQPFFAENLCAGDTVFVTVFDNSNPILLQEFNFVVPLDTLSLPFADAGEDQTLNCLTGVTQVDGSGTEGYDYEWVHLETGFPISENLSFFPSAAGKYILNVTNPETGCSAQDTMMVMEGITPIAEAGDDLSFTCLTDTLMLDGTGSAVGDTISYTWVALEGGDIVTGDENFLTPQITGPGLYEITVRNNVDLCTATDTVRVHDDAELPEALINNGAETITLACEDDVLLNASTQNNPPVIVEYNWENLAGDQVAPPNSFSASVNELGTYILIASNTLNGCTSTDTIQVVPNEDFPVITTTPASDSTLTCAVETIQLTASVNVDPLNYIFNWAATNGGEIVMGTENTLTPSIVAPGLYTIEVTDTTTNCTALAEITIGIDTIPPVADAGPDLALTCTVTSDTLVGPMTSTGDNFTYSWTDVDGTELSTESFLVVSDAGTYCLEVTNTDNGCTSTDCADVVVNNELPVVTINMPAQNITCANDTLTLTPDMISSPNPYIVQWTGDIIGDMNSETVMVDVDGVYQIMVIDTVTGCVGTGDFIIGLDTEAPVADIGQDTYTLNCLNDGTVTLGPGMTATGDNITYTWLNTIDGETPTPDNEISLTVSTPGTYLLTVTNTDNGCSATDEVVVDEDLVEPVVSIASVEMLTCDTECVDLTADAGGLTDITVLWVGLDGGAVDPADQLTTTVCEAGNYSATITNNVNGCSSADTILVEADLTTPEIMYEQPADITCDVLSVEIDASATGANADFDPITWTGPGTISPASGDLVVTVDASGEYTLTVVNTSNGCETTETIMVGEDTEAPIADAGDNGILDCGMATQLDGTGSSTGAEFTYQWTTDTGVIDLDGDTTTPTVSEAGEYTIEVTNTENGCVSSDATTVEYEFPGDAVTMPDSLHCGDTITISANTPIGTVGVWTTTTPGIIIADPTSATTQVYPLQAGDNVFTWTLSSDPSGCDNYSFDELIISSEADPIANNDLIELTEEIRFGSTNIAGNDIVTGDYIITILSEPAFGQMDSLVNGVYHYSVGPGGSGETEVQYEICSTSCPDLCDEGTIIIMVPEDPNQPEVPNTITPNDDGLNDVLIFDIIANNAPDHFPDNEIIIFNRWGDIVYQAAPYNNDWNGQNDEGKELPHGTYYYILRLDISAGEIIRGDVTIIK